MQIYNLMIYQYLAKTEHKLHDSTVGLYICLEHLVDNDDDDIDDRDLKCQIF